MIDFVGWPGHAPFDAIAVAAGGPDPRLQELVRIRRVGPDRFEQENLDGIRFVPLVGAQGWKHGDGRAAPL